MTGSLSPLVVFTDADASFFHSAEKNTSNDVSEFICCIFRLEWYLNNPKNLHIFPGALLAPVGGQLHAPCCGKLPNPISFNPECCESLSRTSTGCRLLLALHRTTAHSWAGGSPESAEKVFHGTLLQITDMKQHFPTLVPNRKHLDKLNPVLQESCVFTVKIFIRSNKSCRCSALTLPDLLFRCLIGGTCIWKRCPKELSSPSKSSLIGPDKSRLKYATCCGISLEYMNIRKIQAIHTKV